MPPAEAILSIRDVSKDYRGLRPLRVASFDLAERQSVALLGFDQAMAEVLVRLIMGASLPDTGEVVVFGQPTNAIADGDAWLNGLERFALLGDRTVLVDQLTAEQTIALPVSFVVDEPTGEVRRSVVLAAEEVGLEREALSQPVATLSPLARARVRLARGLMSSPRLLLAEHPSASLSGDDTNRFAADVSRAVRGRGLTMLLLTADRRFATAAAGHVLTLEPSTGALTSITSWRRWFNG